MPELPEVETVKLGLEKLIIGNKITSENHDWAKSFPNDIFAVEEFMIGANVRAVRRRAKVLLIDLDSNYTLMVHLRMTGQLVYVKHKLEIPNNKKQISNNKQKINIETSTTESFNFDASSLEFTSNQSLRFGAGHPSDSLISKLPDKSTRVDITFSDNSHLYFNDQRKFGWMKLLPTELVPQEPFMLKVGPEPLEPEFTEEVFLSRVSRRANTSIKAAILDQTVLAGVGNIYADESLWGARIHPATLVKNVSKTKLRKLHNEIVYVLKLSIKKGGSTDRNYVNAEGKKGSYIEFAKVFRKENQPCPRCGTTIIKTRVATRGTHTCPKCQVIKNANV
jgi:formamidopyrimidine-DNA glycosylase